jgi:hypothetical protein
MGVRWIRGKAGLICFCVGVVIHLGCGVTSADGDETSIAQSHEAISGSGNYINCNGAEVAKMKKALTYAFHRVKDDGLAFERCMGDAYLWENEGVHGRTIAKMLAGDVVTEITCSDLHVEKDASGKVLWTTSATAYVSSPKSEEFTVDRTFIMKANIVTIAGVMIHEITHNRGFPHDSDTYYSNSVAEQAEACILKAQPNAPIDKGYALYWDGVRKGHAPQWAMAQGVKNCQWNVEKYPNKKIECFFDGRRLGYELYYDGVRHGYEPSWTPSQGKDNCKWNQETYPATKVECHYRGRSLGYQLFRDGFRMGHAPAWNRKWAENNCYWNKAAYPQKKVECLFDSQPIGYELFIDGKRVGYEPLWTAQQAKSNCQFNSSSYPMNIVNCRFDGLPVAN